MASLLTGTDRNGYQAVSTQDPEAQKSSSEVTSIDQNKFQWNGKSIFMVLGSLLFSVAAIQMYSSYSSRPLNLLDTSDAEFDSQMRYVLKNFDKARPMSNFLNGLGGLWGVPMWAFYVNRGQGITSFGKQNKDNAIAKFLTAEKAYQQTPFTGFRTFIKGQRSNGDKVFSMPFFPNSQQAQVTRDMMIGLNEMEIEEKDLDNQLQTNILYFLSPNQDFPSLVRKTSITNLADSPIDLDVLDGLAKLVPNGLKNSDIDNMGRTMEAWMNVYNTQSSSDAAGTLITQPFFHISQDTADNAQVRVIKDGYFTVSYLDSEQPSSSGRSLLPFVIDPTLVFDRDTSLTSPSGFFSAEQDLQQFAGQTQGATSRTPCAFSAARLSLQPGQRLTITSVYGYADSLETFTQQYSPLVASAGYSDQKRSQAAELADQLTHKVSTATQLPLFDQYVKQDFLDNLLRGGLPLVLGSKGEGKARSHGKSQDKSQSQSQSQSPGNKIFHVYSRIHGDIERDYNYFQLDTTYFSQGPGNFRDVSQNRRLDTFHTPEVGDFNVRMFLSFIQADGYNPLTVASTLFKVPTDRLDRTVQALQLDEAGQLAVKNILAKAFRPGQFFRDAQAAGVVFGSGHAVDREQALQIIVDSADQDFAGQFAQNGFWADHWTYTLDLLEGFLDIFPDHEQQLLFQEDSIPFFLSPAFVRPRQQRYSLIDNPLSPRTAIVRAYTAIATLADADFPKDKQTAVYAVWGDPNVFLDGNGAGNFWQRSRDGSVFKVSPIGKLAMLGALKFSTLDPRGMGVEMEGGKPGWNDAMNGLPGLLGSGMPETFEMLRVVAYCRGLLQRTGRSVRLPVEFVSFLQAISAALDTYDSESASGSGSDSDVVDFKYWDACNTARETYRAATAGYFSGDQTAVSADYLVTLLQRMESHTRRGIDRALTTTPSGLSPTYFFYDCTDFSMVSADSSDPASPANKVHPNKFELRTLPLFLEGPTRHLKVVSDLGQRREIYQKVKSSALYDAALKMYTLCESLADMGQDVGRMKAFSAGWLENQSVWLHMSYKFYLELLRGGLYEEFFAEMRDGLVPFMDHEVYGRSPLEAASFIVSSAFPDKKLHGSSFLARLSGSTAEFLSMWALMMAGPAPFTLAEDKHTLRLHLSPVLPDWLFDNDNKVSFTFLGEVSVTYVNPSRGNTWQLSVQKVDLTDAEGKVSSVSGAFVDGLLAEKVRSREIKQIEVHLA